MQLTKEHFLKIYGDYLEPNTDINQKNVVFKCPFHADSNPSYAVSTDPTHPVGHCWSCGAKHSWVNFYMTTRGIDYITALKQLDMFDNDYKTKPTSPKFVTTHPEQLVPKAKRQHIEVDYSDYCYKVWNDTIASDTEYAKYGKRLYELRGITYDTAIACMIGYDNSKGWIFPFQRFPDHKCTGYEIRHKEFKKFDFNNSKCYKAKDSESCLSIVYEGWDNKRCIVNEGFIDSAFMYQYLHEKAQLTENSEFAKVKETILTPTNGVKTIPELVKSVELWNKFDEILFVLDNDPYKLNEKTGKMESPGNDTINELKQLANEHGRNFKFFTGLKEGQDWEDYYKEHRNELLKITT